MADDGKLYASLTPNMVRLVTLCSLLTCKFNQIEMYKDKVLAHCDYLLPNQTECEFLTGVTIANEQDAFRFESLNYVCLLLTHL